MDGGHSKWMAGHSKKSKEGHSKTSFFDQLDGGNIGHGWRVTLKLEGHSKNGWR